MTQDATTKQTTPNLPGIRSQVFCCSGSDTAPKSSLSLTNHPHLVGRFFSAMFLYTVLLVLAKRSRVRILDRWQGCILYYLKSMGWVKYGASDNIVKRAALIIQYQYAQSNHC